MKGSALLCLPLLLAICLVEAPTPVTATDATTVIIWQEDWEGGGTDWHADNGTWESGIPTSGPGAAFTGACCAATGLGGNYPDDQNTRFIRHVDFVVPPAAENPRLRFWSWFSFSSSDYGLVQIKTDHSSWVSIGPTMQSTSSEVWSSSSIDLSAYADSTVQIAFYLHSQNYAGGTVDVSSGWYIDEVSLVTGPLTFKPREGFEEGIGDWSVSRGTWEIGTPTSGPGVALQGSSCMATRLAGNYHELETDTRLISPPFAVPEFTFNPRLRFWHWFSFGASDYGQVQVRAAGEDWETISVQYTASCSNVWTLTSLDLSAYAGRTVQVAFQFYSHNYAGGSWDTGPGWYIDEVYLATGQPTFYNPERFDSGWGDWAAEKGTWEIGVPTALSSPPPTHPSCAGTRLAGNYDELETGTRLVSPPFTVPELTDYPALRFEHWFSFGSDDYGQVQIRPFGGSWEVLHGNFSGSGGGTWTSFYLDLDAYAGQLVQIGFYFYSHNYAGGSWDTDPGWYIDNVRIDGYPEVIPPVAVFLSDFRTELTGTGDAVDIRWSANVEQAEAEFRLTARQAGTTQVLPFQAGSTSGVFTARDDLSWISGAGSISYALECRVGAGAWQLLESSTVFLDQPPLRTKLAAARPNPFNPQTMIAFTLRRDQHVKLAIYDLQGRLVSLLVEANLKAGDHAISWHGRDDDGHPCPSGTYVARLEAEQLIDCGKLMLVR
jgi:hypothetical protein